MATDYPSHQQSAYWEIPLADPKGDVPGRNLPALSR